MASDPQMVYRGHTLVDNSAFWETVNAERPDFARIKEMIAEAHRNETGQADATEHDLSSWLRIALRGTPGLRKGISATKTPPRDIIHPDLAAKFDALMLRPCLLCMPYQKVHYISFRLRTEAVSLQAKRKTAFKLAVKDYLVEVNHDFSDFYNERLCIAVLFVMRRKSQTTDVDNMAKPLLDALEGFAYADDRQVDHLDTIRLNSGCDDEAFIGIRIAVTGIAENADVLRPEFAVQWVKSRGIAPIDLTPYLKNNHPTPALGNRTG
jgi:Holliday junction resolvase RusA-like endonuclease